MPRTFTLNRCTHGFHTLAIEDRGGGGAKKILGGGSHACTWSEVWRYAFHPCAFLPKLFAEIDGEWHTGTLVQVMQPAADGTTGMVGMVGMVVPFEDGEVCDIPDPGGVPVYFNWPDAGLHGRIARERLRVVGYSDFVPDGPWDRRGVVTVENDRIVTKTEET